MFSYSAFGLSIHSELELPELPPGSGDGNLKIRLGAVSRSSLSATLSEEFACTHGLAAFHIRNGTEITVDPFPGADIATVRSVLLGKIMAFLMRQRGYVSLHASAVVIGECAVLFAGISTAGKSTTAAAFYARGHSVIADDLSPIAMNGRQTFVQPAWSWLRLLGGAQHVLCGTAFPSGYAGGKQSFHLAGGARLRAYPVSDIFFLKDADRLGIEQIPALEAAMMLDQHTFIKRLRMSSPVIAAQMKRCASISSTTPVHWLIRRRDFESLPALVSLVEAHVAGLT